MKIDANNLDSLRKLIRNLENENRRLKEQLKKANIAFETINVFEEKIEDSKGFDPDQGERIINMYITEKHAKYFFWMFWGRTDVYAKRGKNGGYFPQCINRWNNQLCPKQKKEKKNCETCENKQWVKLTLEKIVKHLIGYKEDGSDVIGIYPLLENGTCRFLVFDFDNHEKTTENDDYANVDNEWHEEVDALRLICEMNGINPLVERSRSGKGAHVWIFFEKPISASLARNFGFLLLDKGSSSINLKSFKYYDRMYPSQDKANTIGNLIALPLQGQALKQGNSAFVDENWNAYPDQWDVLLNQTKKLTLKEIEEYMIKWESELAEEKGMLALPGVQNRVKPWKKKDGFKKVDVIGKLHIVLGDGIYVDTLNIMPRLQNQIRSMAAFDNPIYYQNRRMGYSNYNNFSAIYMGKDIDGYIQIPRGLYDNLINACKKAQIEYDVEDEREKGRPIRVEFNGDLKTQQDLAAQELLTFENGVLNAATAFGKTVVCSYLISQRKVSTLIIVHSKDLLEQWIDELNKFLMIDEQPPTYKTKTGREKKRDSVIGILHGSKNTLTGIIDVAMVGSIYSKGKFNDLINSYGMVIMDECHHCGSSTAVEVMKKVNAKYVYGVSATPKRGDHLENIIFMMLGPIRYSYTAKERAKEQGIGHYVYPRYTRVVDTFESKRDINRAFSLISSSSARNEMILKDTRMVVKEGRTPVILTKYKEQAKYIYDNLQKDAEYIFILYGDNSDSENLKIRKKLKEVPKDKSLILVATGQKIGEGFDYPRLDTLMLASPVSAEGRHEQYIGRINRDYEGKKDVIVYDYVDSHIGYFDKMYLKRLKTYKRTGYSIVSNQVLTKQSANAIYDAENYSDVFEQDIIEAERRIIVASPELSQDKVERFIYLVKLRQEAGCEITVITTESGNILSSNFEFHQYLIKMMAVNGINVIVKEELLEHFSVIDEDLVWHGGMNLLGKKDIYDNLMRIKSNQVAVELLEITLGEKENNSNR